MKNTMFRRVMALLLSFVLIAGYIPSSSVAAETNPDLITTVADPETLTRPSAIYGNNTQNAGKVTVGKSVAAGNGSSAASVSLNNTATITASDPDNFLVTITQTAQVMGLASESAVPLDVVFVLDTSGSMNENGVNRAASMVTAANSAIATLMAANEHNRVGVVAFSSNNYGQGTSNNAAANVLSSLAHYTGTAATSHLTWVNEDGEASGNNRNFIAGRDTVNRAPARRRGYYGGTNIQAGIITGAKLLTADSNVTTVQTEGGLVTRMPFLVVLSDGQPTYTYSSDTWYDPDSSAQQGPGDGSYPGNGFITATTAAYYKSLITEKYYGANASEKSRCFIYTIGVQLTNQLAQITMDPQTHFVEGSQNTYYRNFSTYWTNYTRATVRQFTVSVDNGDSYTYTAAGIRATRDRVLGKSSTGKTMYNGSLAYNDDYFAATSTADIAKAFNQVISSIQEKAISAPTKVTESGAEFSGYVNFYDTIGEYMEVKDMKGIVADGHFYQGRTFADLLVNPGTNAEFDDTLRHMLSERLALSESNINVDDFIAKAAAASDGTNSICWWGREHDVGEEDIHMQVLANADNDSIDYIESASGIPSNATHVCRSYFYYGTAGNTAANPNHEYLYFVIRVQRELKAPYQQTVVISCPASLLSMDKVSITEDVGGNFTAKVEKNDPARVVYEVGLRSDITAQNVKDIVSADYADEKTVGTGAVNYDAATDTYYFFTNDWNRSAEAGQHQRAMTKATFDAAADNSYYAYQEDTPLLVKNADGTYSPYTGAEPKAGQTFYYLRTYYSWEGQTPVDGVYPAEKKTAYIPVTIEDGVKAHEHILRNETNNQWYVKKGTYTAATTVAGDETHKTENTTGTAANVKYVSNTTNLANSHYTVMLGNNGRLSLKADTTKTVSGQRGTIALSDGSTVMIGDELTYSIKVVNNENTQATATVTDSIPAGTEYVANSATHGGTVTNGTVKWSLSVPANSYEIVSFKVKITEAVLNTTILGVDNTATVSFTNGPSYTTNTTHNPPSGKSVEGATDAVVPENGIQVGDELIYRIRYTNDTKATATVTITDKVPEGTYYLDGTASHNGTLNADGELVWTIANVASGASGIVSFRVVVHAGAKSPLENSAQIKIGTNDPVVTNKTETTVLTGNLTLSKTVTVPAGYPNAADRQNTEFTLLVKELGPRLNGAYEIQTTHTLPFAKVLFESGKAYMADAEGNQLGTAEGLTIKHGQSFTILGLPAGTNFSISETAASGYTPTITGDLLDDGTVDIPKNGTAAVAVENSYAVTSTSLTLEATKTLTGRTLYDDEFSFVVLEGAAQVASARNEGKKVVFTPIHYTAADIGTHLYTVKELQDTLSNVTYDTTVFTVQVEVTDNGDGTLATNVTYPDGPVAFQNTYTPPEVSVNLAAKKVLTGRSLRANEFSFQVKDESGKVVATGTNAANGNIVFSAMGFKTAGTYTYTITEVIPDVGRDPYMRYDTSEVEVTVVVTYDAGTGRLSTQVQYPQDVTFENTQFPSSISVTPTSKKDTTVASLAQLPSNATFSFTILSSDENGTAGDEVGTGLGDANGTVAFSKLNFTDAGTYWYLLKETHAGQTVHGITYDAKAYLMRVEVSLNDGELSAAQPVYYKHDGSAWVEMAENETVQFNNEYNAKGQLTITAGKILTGGRKLNVGDFAFHLIRKDNGHEIAGVLTAVDGQNNGTVTFATLYYDLDEEFKDVQGNTTAIEYEMSEVIPTTGKLPGVSYDGDKHQIVVTLTHNADGTISAEVTSVDGQPPVVTTNNSTGVVFENTYAPTDTSTTIELTKKLEGRTLKAGEFAFKLFHITGGQEKLVETATNDAQGNVAFYRNYYAASFPFESGSSTAVVEYVIREVNGGLGGVTYSSDAYGVKVTVKNNTNTGSLEIEAVEYYAYSKSGFGQKLEEQPVFNNRYSAQGTTYTPTATKKLEGRDINANEFNFLVTPVGSTEPVSAGQVQKDGSVKFSAIGFANAGTYTYAITEVTGNLGGVAYSKELYYLQVKVVDEGVGELKVQEAKYYTDATCITEAANGVAVFTNRYTPEAVEVNLRAWKLLTNKHLTDGEFQFTLTGAGQNQKVSNLANGLVVFETITYTKPGTYVYTLREVVGGNDANYTYDTAVYEVTVEVTDNGQGKLLAHVTYEKDGEAAQSVEFVNKFKPSPIAVDLSQQIDATKTMKSDALDYQLKAGEFTFQVYRRDELITTGTNDANGKITFQDKFHFDTAGVYTFRIVEQESDRPGITTDSRYWLLQVQVRYNEQTGLLYIQDSDVITANQNNVQEAPAFVNHYVPEAVTATITAKKTLEGRPLASGEFLFRLMEGTVVRDEVRNGGEGHIHFNLRYNKVGTYRYTVVEVNEGKPGITYTDNKETVTVTVTNNAQTGKLEAKVTYGDSEQLFENSYTITDGSIQIPGVKVYRDSEGQPKDMQAFSFGLYQNGKQVAAAKNDPITGSFSFYLPFTKDQLGTHTYTMKEIPGKDPSIRYDSTTYEVVVTVADNKAGGLDITYSIDGTENATAEFENVYQIPDPVDVYLSIQKILENKSEDPMGLDGFQIDLDLQGVKASAVTDKEGKASFHLQFSEKDVGQTYQVKVSEKKGKVIGVSYDKTVHTLNITVIRNEDGTLGTLINEEQINSMLLTFTNTYYGKDSSPSNGDNTQLLLPLGMMLISIAGMGLLLLQMQKSRYKGQHSK